MKRNWVTNNIGLKIISFLLAVTAWFYINGEIRWKTKQAELSSELQYVRISKLLPIRVDIVGRPVSGYRMTSNRIDTKPSDCLILGSKFLLDKVEFIQTEPIDVTDKRRTFTTQTYLRSIVDGTRISGKSVEVTIPIERTR